jgi:hypothetical protein
LSRRRLDDSDPEENGSVINQLCIGCSAPGIVGVVGVRARRTDQIVGIGALYADD